MVIRWLEIRTGERRAGGTSEEAFWSFIEGEIDKKLVGQELGIATRLGTDELTGIDS